MAKNLDFKDFLSVDYTPGMDPIIKKAAKKRKGNETETSGPSEATELKAPKPPGIKAPKPVSGKAAQAYIDGGKHATDVAMGYGGKHTVVREPNSKKHVHVFQYESVEVLDEAGAFSYGYKAPRKGSSAYNAMMMRKQQEKNQKPIEPKDQMVGNAKVTKEEVELDEALSSQQRRMRAMSLHRIKAKIELGKERASRRFADLPRLKNRARKEARALIFKKLTKGIPKDELTYQRRQDIEKRMDTPGMKKRIDLLATKMLKDVRSKEIKRHQSSGQQTQND